MSSQSHGVRSPAYGADVLKMRLLAAGLAAAWMLVALAGLSGLTAPSWGAQVILNYPAMSLVVCGLLVALALAPAPWLVYVFPVDIRDLADTPKAAARGAQQ